MAITYKISDNYRFNSKEISFSGKPPVETRRALKDLKFRWNPKTKVWYGFAYETAIVDALVNTLPAEEQTDSVVVTDGYMGGGAYYGGNSRKGLYGQDMKKAILAEAKKEGLLGVTCRVGRGGYTDSFTFTIALPAEEILDETKISSWDGTIQVNHYHLDGYEEEGILSKNAVEKLHKLNQIIQSFNWDESNAMVDYFSTNFYYDLRVKKIR